MSSEQWLTIVSAILAVAGFGSGLFASLTSARKSRVDEIDTVVDTLAQENVRLRERVGELEARLQTAHGTILALEKYIIQLLQVMQAANLKPPQPPDSIREIGPKWDW